MARQPGVHVEYDASLTPPMIARVFSNETHALRSAVKNKNDVVFLEFGEDLETAIQREREEETAPKVRMKRTSTNTLTDPKPSSVKTEKERS